MTFPNLFRLAAWAVLPLFLLTCRADAPVENEAPVDDISGIDFRRTENVVAVSLPDEPDVLNPYLSTLAYSRYVHEHIFQTLNHLDLQTYELVPMLASRPEVTEQPDGTFGYRYQLDERATWPNGTPVTTADMDFSIKLLFNPLAGTGRYGSFYSDIYDLEIEDDRTFTIKLKNAYWLGDYALASLYVYPAYAYDPDGLMSDYTVAQLTDTAMANQLAREDPRMKEFADSFTAFETGHSPDQIVGSGAYELESWEPQQRIILSRRDNYWADGTDDPALIARPEGMEFEIIPDPQTAVVAMQDELVDVVIDMDVERFAEMRTEEPEKVRLLTEPSFNIYSIIINMEHPLLQDAATRRALAHLMNVDLLLEEYYHGLGTRLSTVILPQRPYYDESLDLIEYDPAEAGRLLAQAGWSDTDGDGILDRDGQNLSLDFLAFNTPIGEAIGQLLREGCRQAGVEINVEPMGGRALYGKLNAGDFQVATYAQGLQTHPDEFSQSWLTTSVPPNGTNRMRFGDTASDAIINQIRGTIDVDERAELYREMQAIFYRETPQIPLFSPPIRIAISRRFYAETSSMTPGFDLGDFVHLQE